MNQYPVIFLSFKDIDGLTFEDAYGQLVAQIDDRMYTKEYEDDHILCYGIAFFKKRCLVRKK